MEWSTEVQPVEFLEATRQSMLPKEFALITANRMGIKKGMNVLEVGCGAGAFSRYIANVVRDVEFTCVDLDENFIKAANTFDYPKPNQMNFIIGDAASLPFDDGQFDAVYSHTFLSCVEDARGAVKEMIRVSKPGAIISSVTTMSLANEAWHTGYYPASCSWYMKYMKLYYTMYEGYEKVFPISKVNLGIPASEMPRFFYISGLKDISILPLARAFSLSDAALLSDEKIRYICNKYEGEKRKAENFMNSGRAGGVIDQATYQSFLEALLQWKEFWLEHTDDNQIWDWFGASALLITGRRF